VVEHDEDTMRAADVLVDFGPGPGVRGGEVIVSGSFADVARNKRSVTGAFLTGREKIEIPEKRRPVTNAPAAERKPARVRTSEVGRKVRAAKKSRKVQSVNE
jgi:excinuclease ABC subunit A